VEPGLGWEAQIRETTGITNDFKKAYNVGLFLARISKPALGYRKALETIKVNGAVNFGQMEGDQEVTIVKCKWY
jgi:hypothetical protein